MPYEVLFGEAGKKSKPCHTTMFTTAIRSFARTPSVSSSFRRFSSRISRQVALSSPVVAASLPRLTAVRPSGALARSFSCSAVAHFGPSVQPNPPSHVLFVGNLPWNSTKEQLQDLFAEFGEVTSVRIREFFFIAFFLVVWDVYFFFSIAF